MNFNTSFCWPWTVVLIAVGAALLASVPAAATDTSIFDLGMLIETDELHERLGFTNPEGGVWRQGWAVKYEESDFTKEDPLDVIVIMFSHNDPGWLKTMEQYFTSQTRQILDNVVKYLWGKPTRHFIWTEISFLSMWWDQASDAYRSKFKDMVSTGQIEIAGGGWVMNDEATAHYDSIINQMACGHEWVYQNLGVYPNTSWSIDPFGHSMTMPHLLSLAGYQTAVIDRAHYAFKKNLAWNKALEFRWRQEWQGEESNTDMITHMFPFFIYDLAHTCGPDPKICSRYEFGKAGRNTLWHDPIKLTTESNIGQMSTDYADQIKKKATLFRTGKTVMIPLGQDFMYDTEQEMDAMLTHHEAIHKYINGRPEMGMNIRFGTLSDYWASVKNSVAKVARDPKRKEVPEIIKSDANSHWREYFPVLRGDFFTHDDVREEYWSGYFTSRPFWKGYYRHVESFLRATELLFTWAHILPQGDACAVPYNTELDHFEALEHARKMTGLFMHHDGVTGTAKSEVVRDYGTKLFHALEKLRAIYPTILSRIIRRPGPDSCQTDIKLDYTIDEMQANYDSIIEHKIIPLTTAKRVAITVFNALARPRAEVVEILVDTPKLTVTDGFGREVVFQIAPVWSGRGIRTDQFKVVFGATALGTGLATYFIEVATELKREAVSKISFHHTPSTSGSVPKDFLGVDIDTVTSESGDVSLSSPDYHVTFSPKNGVVTKIELRGRAAENAGFQMPDLSEDFVVYTTSSAGAYLFMPRGPAQSFIAEKQPFRVVKGPVIEQVVTELPKWVTRTLTLSNMKGIDYAPVPSIEVSMHVALDTTDQEVAQRWVTSIKSEKAIYTDSNGFQMKRRLRRDDRPIQHNYFPMTETVFIQDDNVRLNVNSRQAHGTASMKDGEVEVMLDRRTSGDDLRGLGESLHDNIPLEVKLSLSFSEGKAVAVDRDDKPARAVHQPTLDNLEVASSLNHPFRVAFSPLNGRGDASLSEFMGTLRPTATLVDPNSALARNSDIHLVTLKLRNRDIKKDHRVVAQFARLQYDYSSSEQEPPVDVALDLTTTFMPFTINRAEERNLTLMHSNMETTATESVWMKFFDIKTILMDVAFNPNGKPQKPNLPNPRKPTTNRNNWGDGPTKKCPECPKQQVCQPLPAETVRRNGGLSYAVAMTWAAGSFVMLAVTRYVRRLNDLRIAVVVFVVINFAYHVVMANMW